MMPQMRVWNGQFCVLSARGLRARAASSFWRCLHTRAASGGWGGGEGRAPRCAAAPRTCGARLPQCVAAASGASVCARRAVSAKPPPRPQHSRPRSVTWRAEQKCCAPRRARALRAAAWRPRGVCTTAPILVTAFQMAAENGSTPRPASKQACCVVKCVQCAGSMVGGGGARGGGGGGVSWCNFDAQGEG